MSASASRLPVACLLACCLLALAGCGGEEPASRAGRRVVIVSAPGLSWALLSPLLAEGRLPALAFLYRSGSAGILVSQEPLVPEVVATTLATGTSALRHRVVRSVERTPGSYSLRPVGADRRGAAGLWTSADALGVGSGVVGWTGTFPAQALSGFMVAGGAETGERGWIFPAGALGDRPGTGESLDRPEAAARLARMDPELARIAGEDLEVLGRAITLYRVYQPRVLMLELNAVDRASHRFWRYHDPAIEPLALGRGAATADPASAARLAGAVAQAAIFVDACVSILSHQMPEQTALLVVSGWGIRGVGPTDYLDLDLNQILMTLGWLSRSGPGQFDPAASRAFALSDEGQRPREIYLNVAGRDAQGSLPPDQAAPAREELARILGSLRTSAGEPLFSHVVPVGAPDAGDGDLEVIPNSGLDPRATIRLGDVVVPVLSLWRRWNEDFAAHDPAGVILAAGDGIAIGRTGFTAEASQVAATALALLGAQASPAEGDGRAHGPIGDVLSMAADPATRAASPAPSGGSVVAPAPVRRQADHIERALARMREDGHLPRRVSPP